MKDIEIIRAFENYLKLNHRTDFIKREDNTLNISELNKIFTNKKLIYPKISSDNGVTKFVIIPDESNNVFKIPIDINFSAYSRYQSLKINIDRTKVSEGDFCAIEKEIYQIAQKYNFQDFFCNVEYVCNIFDSIPVYKQVKVKQFIESECYYYCDFEDFYKVKTLIKNFVDTKRLSFYWLYDCFKYYGFLRTTKFLKFLEAFNLNNDLHCGNIGYLKNGQPVIFDYSGVEF